MPEQSYLRLRLLGLVFRLPRSIRWYFYTYKIRQQNCKDCIFEHWKNCFAGFASTG